MRYRILSLSIMLLAVFAANVRAQCTAPPLTDQQIKSTVDQLRTTEGKLPPPYPKYRWIVHEKGCHYIYVEYGIPEMPEYARSFTLNRSGSLVDVDDGRLVPPASATPAPSSRVAVGGSCPSRIITENELAAIIAAERSKQRDLPPSFPRYRIRVERLRCLYLYFEYALPETRGNYQVFTIDPYGELMEFSKSEPY